MLRIGLTGGIGAGKSTVSRTFADCGGVIVDGDVIAREVVAPGTDGLAALVTEFGPDILLPDGALNRPALAAKAFVDEQRRTKLNSIVHPLVARRRAEIIESVAAGPAETVVIEDIPLLVESQMAPLFPLVVIVHADADVRLQRLIGQRGMSEADARARIAAQATEEQRRQVADVWLDNSGTEGQLVERARELWYDRLLPFAHNIAAETPVRVAPRLVPADPTWPEQAQRIVARLNTFCGHRALRIDHIGSTAIADMDAKDVIDIQITVASLEVADRLAEDLLRAGYPRNASITADRAKADGRSVVAEFDHCSEKLLWRKAFHASGDPGRPTNIHLRVAGWPNQQFALLFVDWLAANPAARSEYLEVKRVAAQHDDLDDYVAAKEPWFLDGYRRAWAWADGTGWQPKSVK
jgi:dephospho-CoA kinase